MYSASVWIYALAAATSVLGSPAPAPVVKRAPEPKLFYANDIVHPTSSPSMEKRTISECQAVNAVVSALKVVSQVAYPFCSSYIHIPVVTSTVTDISTVTPSPVSVTATVTPDTVSTTITTVATNTVPGSTTTVYSHYTPPVGKEKRAGPTPPPNVAAFGAAKISQACSCLSISPSTTTVTATVATTLPPSTITETVTAATPTTTIVSTSTTTVSVGPTTTIPALCAPSALSLTSGVLSTQGNDEPTLINKASITDIGSCCAACLGTQNCLTYFINAGSCDLFIAVDTSSPNTANAAQAAICPLGVSSQDTIFPAGVTAPESGDGAFHVGPCLVDAAPLI